MQHLLADLVMRYPMVKITSTLDELLQWNSLVSLRLVHNRRFMCDLMNRNRGADVVSMNSWTEKICWKWASKGTIKKRTLFLNYRLNYMMNVVVDMFIDNGTLVDDRALFREGVLGET